MSNDLLVMVIIDVDIFLSLIPIYHNIIPYILGRISFHFNMIIIIKSKLGLLLIIAN